MYPKSVSFSLGTGPSKSNNSGINSSASSQTSCVLASKNQRKLGSASSTCSSSVSTISLQFAMSSSTLLRPKRAFCNRETRPRHELGDIRNKPFSVSPIIAENVVSNGGVTNHDKISRASGEPVNGSVVIHPLEEWKKKSSAEKIRNSIELGSRHPLP